MGGIQKNEIKQDYGYVETFQKILYRMYKKYNLDKVGFDRVLDIHSRSYNLLCNGTISKDHYFEVCGKITDKFNKIAKDKRGIHPEMIQDVKNLYAGIQNRYKENNNDT